MKCRFLSLVAISLLSTFTLKAQESVAPNAKKLQQLYLSVGTGPAVSTNTDSNPFGGTYLLNFTSAFSFNSAVRLNFQHSGFTNTYDPAPGIFSYLNENDYQGTYFPANESFSISLLYGKKKQLNKLVQLQALGGLGFNIISKLEVSSNGLYLERGSCIPDVFYLPGALLQAEVMFLPSKFAGLTAGAYVNLTPKLPSTGINLSLNLGLLKSK